MISARNSAGTYGPMSSSAFLLASFARNETSTRAMSGSVCVVSAVWIFGSAPLNGILSTFTVTPGCASWNFATISLKTGLSSSLYVCQTVSVADSDVLPAPAGESQHGQRRDGGEPQSEAHGRPHGQPPLVCRAIP